MPLPPSLPSFPVAPVKISLRWLLVIPFVLQTVGATALVGYLSYRSGQQAVENLANQLLRQTSERVSDRLSSYLQPSQQVVASNYFMVQQGILNLNNREQLRQQLWQQINSNRSIPTTGFWSYQGNALIYVRISTKQEKILAEKITGKTTPIGTVYLNEISSNQRRYYLVDPQGKPKKLNYIFNDDFRKLAWYLQAKTRHHQHWTPVFVGRVSATLETMTVAPVYSATGSFQGLFTANYFLSNFSTFLNQLHFSPSGQVFVIDRSGNLVATSVLSEAAGTRLVNGKRTRLPAINSQDNLTRETAQQLIQKFGNFHNIKNVKQLSLRVNNQRDFVQVTPFKDNYGLDWLVVTVIPESDFMAQIHSNNRITILLCLLTLSMAIGSGLIIAHRFTTRISRLNKVSQQLAAGNLTQRLPDDSPVLEVQGLAQSFNLMADQLEESFDRIKIALEESKEKFTTIFRTSPDPIAIVTTAEGRFVEVNPRMSEYYGYSREEFISHTTRELQLWANLEQRQQFRQLLEQGAVYNFETTTRIKSGEIKVMLLSGERCNLQEQDVTIIVIKDITDRKQAEIARQESETRLRLALEASGAIAWERDLETDEMVFTNTVTPHIPDKIPYLQAMTLVHPEDREILDRANQEAIAQRGTFQIEHRIAISLENLEWRWFQVSAKVLTDPTGKPSRIIGMSVDITDRHQLDTMKNEFVSMVSHELRTPLTSIRGSLGILESGVLKNKPDKTQQMLQIAVNNTDRLVRLVNDILDLQRLESGKVPLVKEICQVNDLIEQAIESVTAIANQANLTLETILLDASVSASSDEIIQTLINLLGNAIKFSPPGSTISLKAELTNNLDLRITEKFPDLTEINSEKYILFSITDQGRGIPPNKLESIFGRFQQVDTSDSREKGGTGLGLAICKNIVQRHQGLIWVESVLGQGSTFYFTLPLGD